MSDYSTINADDLNLSNYPSIEAFKNFKEKILLVLYIVVPEEKGEYFSVDDVLYITINILGISFNKNNANNIFTRNKYWFHIEKIDGKNRKNFYRELNPMSSQ